MEDFISIGNDHKFDLTGRSVGENFTGCRKCGYVAVGVATVGNQCPQCGDSGMHHYRVTEEDLQCPST